MQRLCRFLLPCAAAVLVGAAPAGAVPVDDVTVAAGAGSAANDLNDRGEVVGGMASGSESHAFVYGADGLLDLGTLGGIRTGATDINDRGRIVGYAGLEGIGGNLYPNTAFLYENGVMRDLGGLVPTPDRRYDSGATGINDLGQIVGRAGVAPGKEHAFLYDEGTMFDLNALIDPASGWEITNAAAINDVGQIAATACKGGLCYAARLDHVPAVPEPSLLALLGGGLALLGWRRRQAWGFTPLAPRCPG